ncbi:glucan endo-1,3-beta-glucosidase 12-like protein [Tanacetum coccineum]
MALLCLLLHLHSFTTASAIEVNYGTLGNNLPPPKTVALAQLLQSTLITKDCFGPNKVHAHASYAMNAYYQMHGRNYWNCDFKGSGLVTFSDPSKLWNMQILTVLITNGRGKVEGKNDHMFESTLAGNVYTVGDAAGWTIPSNKAFYTLWAAQIKFKVTDVLWFNFTTGNHTVAEVSKEADTITFEYFIAGVDEDNFKVSVKEGIVTVTGEQGEPPADASGV